MKNWQAVILSWMMMQGLLLGQTGGSISQHNPFEIAGIEVNGQVYTDREAIISISGLAIGQSLNDPQLAFARSLRALYNQQLFSDVRIEQDSVLEDLIWIKIVVLESPRLSGFELHGLKRAWKEDLTKQLRPHLREGMMLNPQARAFSELLISDFLAEKAFPDATIEMKLKAQNDQAQTLHFHIQTGEKARIADIQFRGNTAISDRKLRRLMRNTRKQILFLNSSKLVEADFKADQTAIIDQYNELGYRDMRVVQDSTWRDENGKWQIELEIEEGQPYYFRAISWKGNQRYSDEVLGEVLGLSKGEVYNQQLLEERLHFSMEGRDISSLYMDHGHLFFRAEAVETAIEGDSIDLEIRLQEGPLARIGKVSISGNTSTSEAVIRRELRTRPGQIFRRADLIRSQREIISLGYFKPESLEVKTEIHPASGTVDIEYVVEEQMSDQLELSAGWDPSSNRLIGTAGISLNNFSLRKALSTDGWTPTPRGDGQQLSLRAQSTGANYQAYNMSFTEPWLGGKKPNALTFAIFHNRRAYEDSENEAVEHYFRRLGASVQLATRLKFPDDYFVSSTGLHFNRLSLNNWETNDFLLEDGSLLSDGVFYNIFLQQQIRRSTLDHPIFPRNGSNVTLTIQLTPPYSLFRKGNSDSFKMLEYHKWRLDAEKYIPLGPKLTLRAAAKFGMLSHYRKDDPLSPFERFHFGGDGWNGQSAFTSREPISMRG
ncbi:MAG: POTRA domain-containing protein, partial [Bacteroidota bacterium]